MSARIGDVAAPAVPSIVSADLPAVLAEAAAERPDLATLIARYFRNVAAEDLPTNASNVIGIVSAHERLARTRPPETARIRVFNPAHADEWADEATVFGIVTDDMPFLLDSVISALGSEGVVVQRVLHPIMSVRRDADGTIVEVLGGTPRSAAHRAKDVFHESWMYVLIDRITDAERAEKLEDVLAKTVEQVRDVVADADDMAGTARDAATSIRRNPPQRPAQEIIECADFLEWLADDHFTFLASQQFDLDPAGGPDLVPVPASGLGLWRDNTDPAGFTANIPGPQPGDESLLVATLASQPSTLAKNLPPFYVAVRQFDETGRPIGEQRFLGNFTSRAVNAELTAVPILRRLLDQVLVAVGANVDSYNGQRTLDLLSNYPRTELFSAEPEAVIDLVRGVLQSVARRQLRIFLQRDRFGRFANALVFLPRDRYTTAARLAMQDVLLEELHGSDVRYNARVGDSALAVVLFVVTTDAHDQADVDLARLTDKVRRTIRTWEDELVAGVIGDDSLDTAVERTRYSKAFDQAYKQDYGPAHAVADLHILDSLSGPDDMALEMAPAGPSRIGASRLKIYLAGSTLTLSRVLPVLQSLGAVVIDEVPYAVIRSDGTLSHIYDFGLEFPPEYTSDLSTLDALRARVTDAFRASWQGQAEVDGFNELVLAAGLNWRQVAVFRACAKYLRQIGIPFTQGYTESVLVANAPIAARLAELFDIRFDPDKFVDDEVGRAEATDLVAAEITDALDKVSSLDADKILRTYLAMVLATERSNAYHRDDAGKLRPFLSFKLDPHRIPSIPKPVPAHEIWVYSPRVEGVHLRFGDIARGGLRWSDRPEDFRTEVLGLVKAQEVKNAVIVPVGAKGGFVVKQPPAPTGDPAADRDAFAAEGVACYRMFIQALLDLTDNRVAGAAVPPAGLVRHDSDDAYLVVAADKGTAKFSDIANGVAIENGFWLGDAFASGGSAGYDHKAMGITARGAWESTKHHFRELGVNSQTEDFTAVGIGDMSGDVFGNGMLLSEHIRLVAAFDHRHIFIDPDPEAGPTWAERQRLFDLPRSSWDDYDRSLISAGGGVWPRSAKSIPINDAMRAVLGIDEGVAALSPTDLIHAILLAPVDLIFNGGVGTYIKASTENHAQVGDKANDGLRVDGNQLRAKVVVEGGNLGVTQLGRIEFARNGGKINTDAIDNSAGVDTSDHEVNIKIALQPAQASGQLTDADRQELLTAMTDEVGELVLADNTAQNRLLGVSRAHAASMESVHARLIDELVAAGRLDRRLEFLPTSAEINARHSSGEGLSSPELSVLIAYVKSALADEMLSSDLPEDPAFANRLVDYFPSAMRERFAADIAAHPLRRNIITTATVNELVNGGGISFAFRLGEEMAAGPQDAIRAYEVTTVAFALPELWQAIAAKDNEIPATVQNELTLLSRRLLDRAARWFLVRRPQPLDVVAEIERYRPVIAELTPLMPRLVVGTEHQNVRDDAAELLAKGAPADLANRVAYSLYTFSMLDIADVAAASGRSPVEVAKLYFALSEHLGLDRILTAVTRLDRGDRWHALARQAVRDGLYGSVRAITADVLSTTSPDQDEMSKIAQWEAENRFRLERARITLGEIANSGAGDLAALSVAAREVRSMAR